MSYAQFAWSRLVFIFGSNLLKHVQRCYDLGSRNLQMTNTAAQVGNPWKWTLNCPCSEVLEDDENTLVVKKLASLIRPRWSSDQFCTICSQSEWTIVKRYWKNDIIDDAMATILTTISWLRSKPNQTNFDNQSKPNQKFFFQIWKKGLAPYEVYHRKGWVRSEF